MPLSPILKTLASFNGATWDGPWSGLITSANGDLFGTTEREGADNQGSVFEIARTVSGFANAPATLASFNGTNGYDVYGGLIADANGDLFGTTYAGGSDGGGTAFEIIKTASGYDSTPTTLATFNFPGSLGSLIADTNGDLFGTTVAGTVFEIAKTATGYANTPISIATGLGNPHSGLLADTNGDLFGTSLNGTIFEIVKTATGYVSTPTILASFAGDLTGSLVADANGDLFGTSFNGGAGIDGTVFELAKTDTGYAPTPTTLASFDGTNGSNPNSSLVVDANGNLFGTTEDPGGNGTVFEIAETDSGYASAPTTLFSFNGTDGSHPEGNLIANANGGLFGTTSSGGAGGGGTVFELTGTGFFGPTTPPTVTAATASASAADLRAGQMVTLALSLSEAVTVSGGVPTLLLNDGGTANYTSGSGSRTLTFSYTIGAGQNTPALAVIGTALNGATILDARGNLADLGGAATSLPGTVQVDTTPPAVASLAASTSAADLGVGDTVTLTVGLSEPVTVSGRSPTLLLNDGGTATYTGGSGSSALTFSYTVAAGQNTADLAVTGTALNGASILDEAGNAADLSRAVTSVPGPLQIDTSSLKGSGGSGGGNSQLIPPPTTPSFGVQDLSSGKFIPAEGSVFADITSDNLSITATVPNAFIVSGTGSDIISAAGGGNNVLDDTGGLVNFEIGGSGNDAFFLDASKDSVSWNTIANFHAGDFAVIYGISPQNLAENAVDRLGVPNYNGMTLRAFQNGGAAFVTFAGHNKSELGSSLATAFGSDPSGRSFLLVVGT